METSITCKCSPLEKRTSIEKLSFNARKRQTHKHAMKLYSSINSPIAISVVALICLSHLANCNDETNRIESTMNISKRGGFNVSKLFNFVAFKKTFHKSYSSFLEEMARKRIFLGRAFTAFLTQIAYEYYIDDTYSKIHENSDWTLDEMRSTEMVDQQLTEKLSRASSIDSLPVADYNGNGNKFEEIAESSKEVPTYKEIIEKLETSLPSGTMQKIVGLPSDADNQRRIEVFENLSDNPDYESPILIAAEKRAELSESDERIFSIINRLPGSKYLNSAIKSMSNTIFGGHKAAEGGIDENETSRENQVVAKGDKLIIDHRNCLEAARNQGRCGSCYVFSTIALYEWKYCQQTGKKIQFSEQYPLDCGIERVKLEGCKGDFVSKVAEFVGKYGLELRGNYPYRKRSDFCPYDRQVGPKKMGYIKVNQIGLVPFKPHLLEKQILVSPVVMQLGVSDKFHNYGGGVDRGKDCNKKRAHSMLIVGTGEEDGEKYWFMRNSYGKSWGSHGGYYKLSKKADCFLENGSGYTVKQYTNQKLFNEVPENKFYDVEPIKKRFYDYKSGKEDMRRPTTTTEASASNNDNLMVTPAN